MATAKLRRRRRKARVDRVRRRYERRARRQRFNARKLRAFLKRKEYDKMYDAMRWFYRSAPIVGVRYAMVVTE